LKVASSLSLADWFTPANWNQLYVNDLDIVWALTAGANADFEEVPGTLTAYNATNVAQELWDSNMNAGRDAMGDFTKFSSPVVANGKVYVITQSNQLQVYGLLGSSQQ
jgi:hypothetical protein